MIFSLVAFQRRPLFQTMSETVYMHPLPGVAKVPAIHVCRLKRFLYGLKQATRVWFEKFHSTLVNSQFKQSKQDYSMFIRTSSHSITALLVYVDDLLIIGNDKCGIYHL